MKHETKWLSMNLPVATLSVCSFLSPFLVSVPEAATTLNLGFFISELFQKIL